MRPRPIPRSQSAGLARQTAVWTFGRGKGPGSLVVWKRGDAPGNAEVVVGGYAGGELFRALGNRIRGGPRVSSG